MNQEPKRTKPSFPNRKISETLIDFAAPLIAEIDENTTERDLRSGFTIAVAIWNAHVMDVVKGTKTYNAMLQEKLKDSEPHPVVLALIRRKREEFFEDMRAIGDFTVRYRNGELVIRAEARDPFSSR